MAIDPASESRFWRAAEETEESRGTSGLHRALRELVKALDAAEIPYAIVGALALGEYGYKRATEDIDVLLTREGLARFKEHNLGRGWVERFPGSKGLRDTRHGVKIDVLLAGEFPGDGKPKPVSFPDPAAVAERGREVALLPLERLIELKLASGMSAAHRLRDLADVLELIRVNALPEAFAERLDPWVQQRYRELWRDAQGAAEP